MTLKYICLFFVALLFFVTFIAPHLFYHLNVIDRHYLGIFDEKIPYLVKDTRKQRNMDRLGMPYITIQDINRDKKINEKRKKLGLPPTYQRHIDKFSFSHNFNKSIRYLQDLKF